MLTLNGKTKEEFINKLYSSIVSYESIMKFRVKDVLGEMDVINVKMKISLVK